MAIENKIAELEEKLKQAKLLKAKKDARERAAKTKKERANETRRKILAGSLVLEMMSKDDETRVKFLGRLDKYLTRADDRALFDLASATKPVQEP